MTPVTLVIPCYNEEDIFEISMADIERFFDITDFSPEYIFVDDCSQDRTPEIISDFVDARENARAIFHEENTGRGGAVTDGIRAADTDIVGFLDIDLEIPIHSVYPLIMDIMNGADVSCAHRHTNLGVREYHRLFLSKGYRVLVQALLDSPVGDTEAGAKFFNRESILPVLDDVENYGWFWSTEVVVRAHRSGLEVTESPVLFTKNHESGSTVNIWKDVYYYAKNLYRFRRKIGREY